ncbi:polysialyltransferase family glycosyltransferase [Glaciecola sp. 33A]|jgi:hypothetical protein|uniref:polysialyltransferase family glycosyltransferase n=1 Tax=Glaciecola sp. 33A TaxID=2057807 RepID=UPI000C346B30|nr:polysialyltransferase family glycosyltransferase [Glaciecola sp. 33A]PKI02289.1 hypothetical protein CXF81_06405 [Glaciecola sp. 33A]
MYNVFYVESPLQMLSANSAYKKFNEHKAILIVNISHGDRVNNDKQLLQLIGNEWDEVYIQKQRKGKITDIAETVKRTIYFFLKYRGYINKYFFGEYRNVDMALLRSALYPNESILLDDGSFTITAQNYYIKNRTSPYPHSVKYIIFKTFIKKLSPPNLYSFFKFESTLLKEQVNYFDLPSRKNINITKGTIYFFGSKFYESKSMHLADELKVLSGVIELYTDYTIFYVPHRDESQSKLDRISTLGYQIKDLGKPAEIYFDETNVMPEIVLSYYSTVLYSCHLRFSNVNLKSICVEKLLLQENAKINAAEIYEYYRQLGIQLLII